MGLEDGGIEDVIDLGVDDEPVILLFEHEADQVVFLGGGGLALHVIFGLD